MNTNTDLSGNEQVWDQRPYVLAGLLALTGLCVHFASYNAEEIPWRMALTAAILFGSLALAFTLSPERWKASSLYAGIAGLVMAGIAWRAASAGDRFVDEEFWVAAGVLAVGLSLPLFQAGFHRLRWRTSYKATHFHVWTDAITGGGALAFVGLSWALLAILAELFSAIQIEILENLMDQEWFGWSFSGAAFGAALGVLRNQLKIIGTLQNVVLLVLSILAVPLAVALVFFLLAVLISGLGVLWEATRSATPLLLAVAVGCFVLTNAVVRDDDANASNSRVLRIAGFVLALGILPLAMMAAMSMGTRVAQHGLSPERLWSLVAIAVAVAYGFAYFVSALRGWRSILDGGWRVYLRQSNLHLAVLTCVVALVLALPIFNFGAVSVSNQLARLQSGAVSVEEFDYEALRWDLGDAGREALATLTQSENTDIARLAKETLDRKARYGPRTAELRAQVEQTDLSSLDENAAASIRDFITDQPYICQNGCNVFLARSDDQGDVYALIPIGAYPRDPQFLRYNPGEDALTEIYLVKGRFQTEPPLQNPTSDQESNIELRPFTGQQIYIDGQPISAPFE